MYRKQAALCENLHNELVSADIDPRRHGLGRKTINNIRDQVHDEDAVITFAKNLLGRPSDFGYHGPYDLFSTWGVYHFRSRDSDLLEQSNSDTIERLFAERFGSLQGITWDVVRFRHWGVGWVEALVIKIVNHPDEMKRVNPRFTDEFMFLFDLHKQKQDYPILDEEYYFDLEHEAAIENILDAAKWWRDPKGWRERPDIIEEDAILIRQFFYDKELYENMDGMGAYPSDEGLMLAYEALGLIESK